VTAGIAAAAIMIAAAKVKANAIAMITNMANIIMRGL
jgi:hypothetical protein